MTLVLREGDGLIEYDLELDRAADLGAFVVKSEGQEELQVDATGALRFQTEIATLHQSAPRAFQMRDGRRVALPSRVVLRGDGRFGFEVEGADPEEPLLIDPGLSWSSSQGGGAADWTRSVVAAPWGEVYACGITDSTAFPTTVGVYQVALVGAGTTDLWVGRYFADQGTLRWVSLVGASGFDGGWDLAVQSDRSVWVCGYSNSVTFPTPASGGFGSPFAGIGAGSWGDAIVVHLSSGGDSLLYGAYIGGSGDDVAQSLVVEGNGRVTLGGWTTSPNLPTGSAATSYRPVSGGAQDAWFARLDANLSGNAQLRELSYFGGVFNEGLAQLRYSDPTTLNFVGFTGSPNFPVTAGSMTNGLGDDAFVSRLAVGTGPTTLLRSTRLGGSGQDYASGLELHDGSMVTVVGTTRSTDFPTTPGAYDTAATGGADAFVARLDLDAVPMTLAFGSYFGGFQDDSGDDLFLWSDTSFTITGTTTSTVLPTTAGAFQPTFQGGPNPQSALDAYVAHFDAAAGRLLYGTFLGGANGAEVAWRLDGFQDGGVVVAGTSASNDFPTSSTHQGSDDAFLVRLDLLPVGVARFGAATTSCHFPVMGVSAQPRSGGVDFGLRGWGAPPSTPGFLLISQGSLSPTPLFVGNLSIWADPFHPVTLLLPVQSTSRGAWSLPMPVPSSPVLVGLSFYAQLAWFDPCIPGSLVATAGLSMTIQ